MDQTKPQGALACKSRNKVPDFPEHIENFSYRAKHFEHRSTRRHVPNDGANYRFERRCSGSGGGDRGDPPIRKSSQKSRQSVSGVVNTDRDSVIRTGKLT